MLFFKHKKEGLNIIGQSFINALGIFLYVVAVSFILDNGEQIFGQMRTLWGPVAFLLLFVFSATVVGALMLGKPAMLYFDNKKKEAVSLFVHTVAWLFLAIVVTLIIQVIV